MNNSNEQRENVAMAIETGKHAVREVITHHYIPPANHKPNLALVSILYEQCL